MPLRNDRAVGRAWVPGPWHEAVGVEAACGARLHHEAGWSITYVGGHHAIAGERCAKCYPDEDLMSLLEDLDAPNARSA